ncbi:MAG: response regulator transcription factor [Acidobacteriales bacterium]|nr:response regulator transcription factor [Terriglobales bacterium]
MTAFVFIGIALAATTFMTAFLAALGSELAAERISRRITETMDHSIASPLLGRRDTAAAEPSRTVAQAGNFLINPAAHIATLRGKLLDLSPAEFNLLYCVLEHHKPVVSTRTALPAAQAASPEVRGSNFVKTLSSPLSEFNVICRDGHYRRMETWTVYRFDPKEDEPLPQPQSSTNRARNCLQTFYDFLRQP